MKPLVLSDTLATVAFYACIAGFTITEVSLAIRTTGRGNESDRSHIPLFIASIAGFVLAVVIADNLEQLSLPGGQTWPVVAGLAIFAAGAAFRYWAIWTCGRFFVFVLEVQEDHKVIDTGPYAIVRHPSYLGLLTAIFGLGLAYDNWLSLAVCFLPPLLGFMRRILLEERFLNKELGAPYADYCARTRRLIPGLWII